MKNSWKNLHPPLKMVIFYLFWQCAATFEKQFSEVKSWNHLNNWKKSSLIYLSLFVISGIRVAQTFVFCVVLCGILYSMVTLGTKEKWSHKIIDSLFKIGPSGS